MVYVEDVFTFSKNMKGHICHCEQFFWRIQEAILKVKKTNCSFGHSIKFLGHVVNQTGIKVDTGKI